MAPALPAGWVASFTPGPANCTPTGTCALGTNWTTSAATSQTAPNAAFHDAPGCVTDSNLDTPSIFIPTSFYPSVIYFWQNFNLEAGHDGGVLEISINGGAFTDILAAGGSFMGGGYNGTISTAFLSPIAGRQAWTGNSGGYINTSVSLPSSTMGHNVVLRFRLATDCAVAGTGWYVDSIQIAYFNDVHPTPTPTATATATATASGTPTTPTPTPPSLIVTTTADSGAGSLRAALADAHDGDIIGFDPALNGQTISLTSAELVIDKNVTISGPGPAVLTVSRASGTFRIFHILPGHTVIIEGIKISSGSTASPGGGVLNDQAVLTVNNCAVSNNFSDSAGGGIYSSGVSAILTINDSTVTGNLARGLAIGDGGQGGGIYNNGTLEIRGSTVSGNSVTVTPPVPGRAGGIFNSGTAEISNSTISGNMAGNSAGGIHNGATMTLIDSTVGGNTCVLGGFGGGIDNFGTLTIRNSTVSGNTTTFKGSGSGGGIASSGPLTISNSTVSGNLAAASGGGIESLGGGTISNSTVSGNSAGNGGGIYNSGGWLQLGNCILKTGASGANIFNKSGTIASDGYNLSSDDGGGFLTAIGDQINTDPILGPLQNNGGSTFTHDLLTGSPAIDAGRPNFTPPPLYDQRGFGYVRVFNKRIDIGSLEVQPAFTPSPTPTATATATGTPTPTPSPTPFPARALNLSTRMIVETGDRVGIGGFIITGPTPKQVLLRGIGPSLAGAGIPDSLADPVMELHGPAGFTTIINDNWRDTQQAEIQATGLAPTNDLESAILATLPPGPYTAIVKGQNNTSGVGLVEVYDLDQAANSQLANISTRAFVGTGAHVTIGGFILGGDANTRLDIFGLGPSLAGSGVSGVLADPTLELRDSNGALLAFNDNCEGIFINPPDPLEACMIQVELPPGAFTVILAGNNGGTGIGLVEIYNVN